MLKGFLPKFTLTSGSDDRRGDGVAMICDGQTMLIDGFEGGEPTNGLATWLANNNAYTIDIAVLTHFHYDHYNGLKVIESKNKFHIKTLFCYNPETLRHGVDDSANGRAVKEDIDNAYAFIRWMQSQGVTVKYIDKGGVIKFGDITWRVFRKQPTGFTYLDGGQAYAFLNDGSLILYSPEAKLLFGGDGPGKLSDAIDYFGCDVVFYDISHHGNSCNRSDSIALKGTGCILAWQSCIERNGVGTTEWTAYGSRRVKQQGIPVWQQDYNVCFYGGGGKITFTQVNKRISAEIPYIGTAQPRWIKDKSGRWWYQYADGMYPTGWAKLPWSRSDKPDKKDWFYFDENGWMRTGWIYVSWSGGKDWFYLDPETGAMLTGLQKIVWRDEDNYFYFDPDNGNMVTGWIKLTKDGNEGWYYFDATNGNMRTKWVLTDGYWYYMDDNGLMQTGWLDYNGKRCYLEPIAGKNQGHAYCNEIATIDGKTYRFDKDCYSTEVTNDDITEVTGKLNSMGESRKQFVIDIANYVRKYAPQYGICVYSPIIAQAIHESGWGESKLSAKYHNYFGLKCGTKWTGKSVNMATQEEYSAGTLTNITANFRAYDSMEEGVKGYFEFIQLPRYANLKGVTSPRQYLENIKNDGYATGSSYVSNTMNLIDLYDLTQFDVTAENTVNENPVDVMIQIATAEVGYHEGANNHTKYGDEMHSIQPSNMDAYAAWCDCFVDWCVYKTCQHFGKGADTARAVLCGDFDDYTYFSVNLYKKANRWTQTPYRGCQIFFGGSGHTGIVTDVVGNTVYTIEGNKSDAVRKCSYSKSYSNIIGYGMPRYDLIK